jgi:flavin reductase (DIM6/NTAB) family NADH-FMN oxidoreductase RutF
MISPTLQPYRYAWPAGPLEQSPHWRPDGAGRAFHRELPERLDDLAVDSRWPAFFPSALCLVTATDGERHALEKVVGASIVNRFPYVVALSFCRQRLSDRHHERRLFTELLESGGGAAVQFLPPGELLTRALQTIAAVPEGQSDRRLAELALPWRAAITNPAAVLGAAYLVYEARLVSPSRDFEGQPIYQAPWLDLGSHRVYFLEITAIQLRQDIADGASQICWRSLPTWQPQQEPCGPGGPSGQAPRGARYTKGYTPDYRFPSPGTVQFEANDRQGGMAVKHLPPLPADQVEVDNDRARWPCFFPSSLGLITTWSGDGVANLMPCGSTTVVSRFPLTIAPCVSYARINERYAPRASLPLIRAAGRFGCGVPYLHPRIIEAIRYAGNTSLLHDPRKIANAGLNVLADGAAPVLLSAPVHYDCEVVGEVRLGTHVMFLGEVRRIRVRADVTAASPLEWYPWAAVQPARGEAAPPPGP